MEITQRRSQIEIIKREDKGDEAVNSAKK